MNSECNEHQKNIPGTSPGRSDTSGKGEARSTSGHMFILPFGAGKLCKHNSATRHCWE